MRVLLTAFTLGLLALPAAAQISGQIVEYDAKQEKTYRATVLEVKDINLGLPALQLITDIGGGRHVCIVGTAAYLKEKGFSFAWGETVTITGVVAGPIEEGVFISAREIKKGEATLVLKDKEGKSVWRPKLPK